ncbi:uncharacterized protein I206_100046 [Kwoniella pini CBS 10737]|uniref:Uncharacterized protein n=1 Tax=Kwoniella pini CBS 10737 TaxID=1296096 RepID=A0A1B9HSE7_9TREE|nr:uncharacterized protein I206_07861 [Kwoniella pini CBS 10737]OCF46191.1 hypothetical protein I206_07861 [Kwoniella pini CBS 10737]
MAETFSNNPNTGAHDATSTTPFEAISNILQSVESGTDSLVQGYSNAQGKFNRRDFDQIERRVKSLSSSLKNLEMEMWIHSEICIDHTRHVLAKSCLLKMFEGYKQHWEKECDLSSLSVSQLRTIFIESRLNQETIDSEIQKASGNATFSDLESITEINVNPSGYRDYTCRFGPNNDYNFKIDIHHLDCPDFGAELGDDLMR